MGNEKAKSKMKQKNPGVNSSTSTLASLKKSLKNLEALLEKIPFAQWQLAFRKGSWSVAEIVHHLILVEVQGLHDLKEVAEGRKASAELQDSIQLNPEQLRIAKPKLKSSPAYEPTSGIPAKYLLEALRRARKETVTYVERIGNKRLREIGINTTWLGPVSGNDYVLCMAYHMERHTEHIGQIASKSKSS